MSGSNKLPAADYRLKNLNNALYVDGNNDIVMRTGFAGNIVISGNVNVPGIINVQSSPEDPVDIHIRQIGTSGILNVDYLPVGQRSIWYANINNFPTSTTITSGNLSIYSLPAVAQSGTWYANINNFPTSTTITSGNIGIYGNIAGITSMPSLNIASMPEVEIKNDSGNPISISANTSVNSSVNPIYVTGNMTTVGGSAQGKLWTMQVAQGLIAGHSVEQVTGYNPTTSAGDAVWSGGTAYPWSSLVTAQTLYLKSSTNNATDRSMPILIDGLDANYNNQTEVVILNASDSRTAVASTKQFLRIHNIMCNGTDTNVGDIITTVTSGSGTVVSKLSAGRGRTQAGVYTVPAGYTGYLFKGDASSTAATVVNFMGRYFGKAFMVLHVAIVDNSTYIYDFPFPMTLPEKTDMYTVIDAGSGKTAVNYEILLVAN